MANTSATTSRVRIGRFWEFWNALIQSAIKYPVAGLTAVFVAGMVFWGAFNWSLELTNTEAFCTSCHAMRAYLYEEYKTSIHYANRTGVRASCPDCHVPREWVHKVVRKVQASNELFHWIKGSIDSREKFEAKRSQLARHVWQGMEATDSRECRNCHGIGFMTEETQKPKASLMHSLAADWGKTCIDCHKGIAHSLPKDFDKELVMDDLHDRMKKEKIDSRLCHEGMAGAKTGEGW